MALKNTNGNYLRISSLFIDVVNPNILIARMELWANQEIRFNPSNFDKPQVLQKQIDSIIMFEVGLDYTSIRDSIITKAYLYLKENGYSDWEDC